MRHEYVMVGDRELHARVWGHDDAPTTIVAWHGMTRNGADFDWIARWFSSDHRVVCPDSLGRGLSQWAERPEEEYLLPALAEQAAGFLRDTVVGDILWIGTSMGGQIGTILAAGPLRDRIKGLVLNDVGPAIDAEAIGRIREYVSRAPRFGTLSEAERYFRGIYAMFGELTDDEWRDLTVSSVRRLPDGAFTVVQDPRIGAILDGPMSDSGDEAWKTFVAVPCPVLVLRGESSDLLSEETACEMADRHPNCRFETIAGCGHAAYLNTPQQAGVVAGFFEGCVG